MSKTSLLSLAIALLVGGQLGNAENERAVEQAGEKPVREEVLNVNYRRPPDTVAQMVSNAAAAIVAEWPGQSRPAERGVSGAGVPLPKMTFYTFRILDIVKLDPLLPPVGDDIDFSVIGGEEELPTHVERTKNLDASDFVRGHRYLMFIGRDSKNELYLIWGPLGIYDITSPVVTSMSPGWRRHDGMDATSFVAAAKAAANR